MATAPRIGSPAPGSTAAGSAPVSLGGDASTTVPASDWNGYSITSCATSCCRAIKNAAFHAAFIVIEVVTGSGAVLALTQGSYVGAGIGVVGLLVEGGLHYSLHNSGRLVAAAEDVSDAARFTSAAAQRALGVAKANESAARNTAAATLALDKAVANVAAAVDHEAVEALEKQAAGVGVIASSLHVDNDAMHAQLKEIKGLVPLMLSLLGSVRTSVGVVQRGASTVGPTLTEIHEMEQRLREISTTIDTNAAQGIAAMKDVFRQMMEHMVTLTTNMSSESADLTRELGEKNTALAAATALAEASTEEIRSLELHKASLATRLSVIQLENQKLQGQLEGLIVGIEAERAAWTREGASIAGAIHGATADLARERTALKALLESAKSALARSRSSSLSRSASRETSD